MAVIKPAKAGQHFKDAIVLDMSDLSRDADRLRRQARRTAEDIVINARREAEQLAQAAQAQGYAEGLERGTAEGTTAGYEVGRTQAYEEYKNAFAALDAAWTEALRQWERERAALIDTSRADIVQFAVTVTQKVVHRVLTPEHDIVRAQITEAIKHIIASTSLKIEIHPDDRAMVEEMLPQLAATMPECKHIALHDVPEITRGGCLLRTPNGHVDATIETQLNRIAEAFVPESDAAPESS